MPESAPSRQAPTVFISYAHESDALRASVAALAEWLGGHGCRVLTDHPYVDRPPPEGWVVWMLGCIEEADTVLVVCTAKLKGRYEKTAAPDAGRGATYEGALVTQRIYDAFMRNTKFFPILPDAGTEDDIPTALKSWWNGHRFPGGNEGIRRMVFAEPAAGGSHGHLPAGGAETAPSPWPIGAPHERLAARLLGAAGAWPFFQSLQDEMAGEFTGTPAPQTAAAMVQRFTECPAEQVQPLFYVVRRALRTVPPQVHDASARRQAEEAAAALYCLAACRLVDKAGHEARAAETDARAPVMHVPSGEPLVCAIIATALFGGELRLVPAEQPGVPRPEYVFEVRLPGGGDQIATAFERAAYVALFPSDREATEVALDTGPLTGQQRAKLAAHIGDIRHVQRSSMALVVYGLAQPGPCQGFATQHQVPILLPAGEVTTVLVGMDAERLRAEIHKFWEALEVLPRPASQPPAHSPPGAQAMPFTERTVSVHVTGDKAKVSVSTGDHSAALAGTGQTAHVAHTDGPDLAVLGPLFRELAAAIGELSSLKARDTLAAHVRAAEAEAGKQDKADPGLIKRALDAIKPAAEVLEGGEKIVALCHKTYQVLAPFL